MPELFRRNSSFITFRVTQNVLWSRASVCVSLCISVSVCVSVCLWLHAYTIARTRM